MRVLLNQLPAPGPKTGIGHYIAELERCLRPQAAADEVVTYPPAWLQKYHNPTTPVVADEPKRRGRPPVSKNES